MAPSDDYAFSPAIATAQQFFLLNNEDGHGGFHIAPEQIGRVWSAAADLFDAPLDAKRAVSVASSANNRGYFSSADHAEYNKDPAGVRIKDNKEVCQLDQQPSTCTSMPRFWPV